MYYEINVSIKGKHLFATAERSITNEMELKKVYYIIARKFPEEEGFCINVTQYEKRGIPIIKEVVEELLKN